MSPAQQKAVGEAASFVDKVNTIILFPLIALFMAAAFFMFLIGCAEYIMGAANNEARSKGIKHITWGIIGLVIMVSAWAILMIAAGTIGLDDELKCANDPKGAGCDKAFELKDK
jgi:TRAP-type C4-dicarboxylate transport system permease small subunit